MKNKIDLSVLKEVKTSARFRVVMMTPEVAGFVLETQNNKNRKWKPRLLRSLQGVLQKKEWELNFQPAILGASGNILDGQHRLEAIHATGIPAPILLVEDADDSIFDTLDSGVSRTAGDVLAINKESNCNQLAATIRWVSRYQSEKMPVGGTNNLSVREVEGFLSRNPHIRESVAIAIAARTKLISPSVTSTLHYLTVDKDPVLAEKFVHGMKTGDYTRQAFHQFRERMIQNTGQMEKLPMVSVFALAIIYWNAAKAQQKLHGRVRWLPSDPFPVIQ